MATKTTTDGASTATKKAKSKSVIQKPAAQLREPLQKKKDLFEQLGWTIEQYADKKWAAERLAGDDPWTLAPREKINDLLNDIFVVENREFISDLTSDEELAMLEWRAAGWIFAEPETGMWEATKGRDYCGRHSMLRALFSQIEGTETGDHKAAIEKMTTELIAGRKKKYADEGWGFIETTSSGKSVWRAMNGSPAFHQIESESLSVVFDGIESFKKAARVNLEKMFEINSPSTSVNEIYVWTAPSRKQQFEVGEFLNIRTDVIALFQTEQGNIEIEYADIGETPSTRVVDKLGQPYSKHRENHGKVVLASILSPDEYLAKFPAFATKVANDELAINIAQEKTAVTGEIALSEIVPSPFEGQQRRRNRFTDEEISELAASIKSHGVLQPIVIRPSKKVARTNDQTIYEIIAGERRFLAAQKADLATIPAVVKNVSDEAAFEIQTIENLQRKDPDPIDEAFSYAEYVDKYGKSLDDLSLKFGKPVKFIAGRLRLKNLIPEVLKDVAAGSLGLGLADVIARLEPLVQKSALDLSYETKWVSNERVPDKTKPKTINALRSSIAESIFLNLKDAKFSTTATNLRPDGLACVNCPQRTNAIESLFEEMRDKKNDRCLNAVCYELKTVRAFRLKREEESERLILSGKAAEGYLMPLLVWQSYYKDQVSKRFDERPLTDVEYTLITKNTGECPNMELGIFGDSNRYGEILEICRFQKCTKHKNRTAPTASTASASTVPGEKTDAEKRAFYERKQEIFDIKVGESVRKKVFAEAAKIFTSEQWIFDEDQWRRRLVKRLWDKIDSNACTVIKEILGIETYQLSVEKLTGDQLSKILFLSIIANEGEMLWGSWRDQTEIREVAEQFGVDYKLLDAKERAAAAPKKFADAAKEHLGKIERGEKAERPVFYKLEK